MRAIAVVGFKKSGKTTLALELAQALRGQGFSVTLAKHSHHGFDEKPDTDTGRFRTAADLVMAFSPGGVAEPPPGPRPRIFIAHGDRDSVIPVETTTQGIAPGLRQLGFRVDVEVFTGGHELRPQKMADGFQWWLRPEDWKPGPGLAR